MEGKTHIVGGIAAGALYLKTVGTVQPEVLFFTSCIAGALLPDICSPTSTIGRMIPLLDRLVSKTFGHRTITHSLFMLILTFMVFRLTHLPEAIELGIWIGMASHLVLDAITVKGIQFLWPLKIRVGIPVGIKTGGTLEKGILSLLTVYIAYVGYQIYLN
ncbi:inner membrane protein [Peribacillus deserti]|uniref:Inner membrane protein n=1 Tax=Peribacillus deserti TaxID=673318 RepID=A0ABS2QE69_9BACI|nr:metal-dependent hydrolase [Peribacillus deserti]MBM7691461.1 inner membrane protein [Peribacillus deserti]